MGWADLQTPGRERERRGQIGWLWFRLFSISRIESGWEAAQVKSRRHSTLTHRKASSGRGDANVPPPDATFGALPWGDREGRFVIGTLEERTRYVGRTRLPRQGLVGVTAAGMRGRGWASGGPLRMRGDPLHALLKLFYSCGGLISAPGPASKKRRAAGGATQGWWWL